MAGAIPWKRLLLRFTPALFCDYVPALFHIRLDFKAILYGLLYT